MDTRLYPIVNYILFVLLRGEQYVKEVAYSLETNGSARVVILPSHFFDKGIYLTDKGIPKLPLENWHGTPLLFGTPQEEMANGKLVIHADIIASSFFLMSRYEELVNPQNKDAHGRYTGNGSYPGKLGFLERPIIDEYGRHLRDCLRGLGIAVQEPSSLGKVYLTHDVDIPWKKWTFYSALRGCLGYSKRNRQLTIWPMLNYFGYYKKNPFDTFDWILEQDGRVKDRLGKRCEDIYFIIGAEESDDYTESYLYDEKAKVLLGKLREKASYIGLHVGYNTGKKHDPEKINKEKDAVEEFLGQPIFYNRNHYLLSTEPSALRDLIAVGITDDFTMGYADRVGFRLGTAQCVRWIDPEEFIVTNLRLHPLIAMDGSLAEKQYMALDLDECITYINKLYKTCKSVKGDFCILFHNNSIALGEYAWLKEAYQYMVDIVCKGNEN